MATIRLQIGDNQCAHLRALTDGRNLELLGNSRGASLNQPGGAVMPGVHHAGGKSEDIMYQKGKSKETTG